MNRSATAAHHRINKPHWSHAVILVVIRLKQMHRNVNDFDREKLLSSLAQLAHAMECTPLAKNDAESLIDYVMGREKNGWGGYLRGIITERELRNLIMAHGATTTARSNLIEEPNCDTYMSQELCLAFEIALFGRRGELHNIDYRDPWE